MSSQSGPLLAGDVGGTSTRLGLFTVAGERTKPLVVERYASRDHAGLDSVLRLFRAAHPGPVVAACFGVAGPVVNDEVETPNLAWLVKAAALARDLGLDRVDLINDLEANAHGIFELMPTDFAVIHPGADALRGNAAVISAGTGLGEAGFYWDGAHHHPFANEGGHADFAPQNDLEDELLRYLRRRFGGHVSVERIVSGPGLENVYEFLRDTGRGSESPELRRALATGDRAAVISNAALAGRSELCARALDLFVDAYGAEAGNLALKLMATAGVYVGGGIAPKILPQLRRPGFRDAFIAKGRLGRVLEDVPVRVITNEHTALFGAARFAALQTARLHPRAL